MSMKNMGRLRRRSRNCWPCAAVKICFGAPVEVMTMSARPACSWSCSNGMTSVVQAIAAGSLRAARDLFGDLSGDLRAAPGAVGDQDGRRALLDQVARGQLGHLAGADEEDRLALSEPKILRARSTATEAMETELEPICVSVRTRLATEKARWNSGSSVVETAPTSRATV